VSKNVSKNNVTNVTKSNVTIDNSDGGSKNDVAIQREGKSNPWEELQVNPSLEKSIKPRL